MSRQIEAKDSGESKVEVEELLKMKPIDESSGRVLRQTQQDRAADQNDPADHSHQDRQHPLGPDLVAQDNSKPGGGASIPRVSSTGRSCTTALTVSIACGLLASIASAIIRMKRPISRLR
jgi:hypothetical protein